MVGFSLRHLGTEAARRAPTVTGADEAPPMVPAQERQGMGRPDSTAQAVPRA
jgi:hypothetical protein